MCRGNLFPQTPPPDIQGFDPGALDYHFSRAGRETDPENWMTSARRGITAALAAWEVAAVEMDLLLINHTGEAGTILYDPDSGDPLVIRPSDGEHEFAAERELWLRQVEESVRMETEKYGEIIAAYYPELLSYIPEGRREEFGRKLREVSGAAVFDARKEFESLVAREDRYFTARRLGDVWSLRRKSDVAAVINEKLIRETQQNCSDGIALLQARIEAAQGEAGDLALAGAAWLDQYREQFERGLRAWEEAEKDFFIRRLEWEDEAGKNYLAGEDVWNAAFVLFEEERKNWEIQSRILFDSGGGAFCSCEQVLIPYSIRN